MYRRKLRRHCTYIAPQAACCSCSGAVRQTKPAYSLGRSPSPHSRTLAYSHTAIPGPNLRCNNLHPIDPCNYMRLPTRGKWKAELAWLADPEPTVCPLSGHRSTMDRWKRPTIHVQRWKVQRSTS